MRRDANRAITRKTQPYQNQSHTSSTSYLSASNVAQTLNLINTKGLTTWREDPWEDDVMSDVYSSVRSNEVRSVASDYGRGGSLFNITNPSLYERSHSNKTWDSQSIPGSKRKFAKEKLKHSNKSANHSSMTSGYASSELDSTSDFNSYHGNYETSSYFDEDSFFNDSYHANAGGQFSTDIFSMLEEGSISCRTPFPDVGDWPDTISELNFDCSNHRDAGDDVIHNCDAHSDIMPSSCNAPKHQHVTESGGLSSISKERKHSSLKMRSTRRKLSDVKTQNAYKQMCPNIVTAVSEDNFVQFNSDNAATHQNIDDDIKQPVVHRITNARRRLSSSGDKYANRTLSLVELESSQLRSALLHPNQPDSSTFVQPQTLQISALHLITQQTNISGKKSGASLKKKLRKSVSVLPSKKSAAFTSQVPYPNPASQRSHNLSKNKSLVEPPIHYLPQHLSPKYPSKTTIMTSRQPQPVCLGHHVTSSNSMYQQRKPHCISIPSQQISPAKVNSSTVASLPPSCGKSSQKVINLELDLNLKGGNLDDVVINSVHAEVSSPASPVVKKPFTLLGEKEKSRDSRKHVTVPIQVNFRRSWNYMSKQEKENLVERLSDKISTMTLQEQLEIMRIIDGSPAEKSCKARQSKKRRFRMSADDIDSHKLTKLLGYIDTQKGRQGLAGIFSQAPSLVNGMTLTQRISENSHHVIGSPNQLRRSNSEGSLSSIANDCVDFEEDKLKRQEITENKSGYFKHEQKVLIEQEENTEEEICVDI